MPSPISVVIACEHPLVGLGVRSVLVNRADFQIVAECSTYTGTLRALKRHHPAILIAGSALCGAQQWGMIESLARASTRTRIALLCTSGGDLTHQRLFEGASAVLSPDTPPEQLLECIYALANGKRWRAPLRKDAHRASGAAARASPRSLAVLSVRERQVLEGIVNGRRNREIAEGLGIVPGTVKLHLNRIFRKLGVNSRLALLKKVLREEEQVTGTYADGRLPESD